MKTTLSSSFFDILGRSIGLLFLALIPLITLVPVNPVPAWLTEDLVLRWFALILLLICSALFLRRHSPATPWHLGLTDGLLWVLTAWALFSAANSTQIFDSFYALKNFLVVVLLWFSLRILWDLFPDLYPRFERFFWATSV
ncbi:MAG TPA: hypothetical protein VK859_03380, partial [bacterium]|nr:hypothetical protein [bacterium]